MSIPSVPESPPPVPAMSEETRTTADVQSAGSHLETFPDVLQALVGKVVTVANPESYEDAPVGHKLTVGFYRAKILAVVQDHLVLFTEFKHTRGKENSEAVKQFIPLERIKRVSIMKSERVLHL